MDFSTIGTQMATAFTAVGNALLLIAGGLCFVILVVTGLMFFGVPIDRRISGTIKSSIGWIIGGVVFLGASGVLGRVFAAAIMAGKM